MKTNLFVIQKLVKSDRANGRERTATWRTISEPASEDVAVTRLRKATLDCRFRALNSPSKREMRLGAEVTEWTI